MLSIVDAQVSYPGHIAFSGFSLEVASHEILSIVGASGCGKTSLLYAIANLIPLSKGNIILEEGPESCAIMFQQDRLLPWKRVIDNVLLGLSRYELPYAEEVLERLGLFRHRHKYPKQLSGGERQRVALARSLVRKPTLLLLDEPLASLDEQNRERLQDEIKQFVHAQGMTLVLVTHSIREAVYMGSRIVLMTSEGITFETENPYHDMHELRDRTELFALERTLRHRLGGVR